MVLTQEEAESSVLCEDTSVAHPKVDVKELSNSSQSDSKHFEKMYFKILANASKTLGTWQIAFPRDQ